MKEKTLSMGHRSFSKFSENVGNVSLLFRSPNDSIYDNRFLSDWKNIKMQLRCHKQILRRKLITFIFSVIGLAFCIAMGLFLWNRKRIPEEFMTTTCCDVIFLLIFFLLSFDGFFRLLRSGRQNAIE